MVSCVPVVGLAVLRAGRKYGFFRSTYRVSEKNWLLEVECPSIRCAIYANRTFYKCQ